MKHAHTLRQDHEPAAEQPPERRSLENPRAAETAKKIGQDWIKAITTCQYPQAGIDAVMTKIARAKSPEEKIALVQNSSQWGRTPEEHHARFTAAFWLGLAIQAKVRQGFLPQKFMRTHGQALNKILYELLPLLPPHIQQQAPICRLMRSGAY